MAGRFLHFHPGREGPLSQMVGPFPRSRREVAPRLLQLTAGRFPRSRLVQEQS